MRNIKSYSTYTSNVGGNSKHHLSYRGDKIYHYLNQRSYLSSINVYTKKGNEWTTEEFILMEGAPDVIIGLLKKRMLKKISKNKIESIPESELNNVINSEYKSIFRENRLKKLLNKNAKLTSKIFRR